MCIVFEFVVKRALMCTASLVTAGFWAKAYDIISIRFFEPTRGRCKEAAAFFAALGCACSNNRISIVLQIKSLWTRVHFTSCMAAYVLIATRSWAEGAGRGTILGVAIRTCICITGWRTASRVTRASSVCNAILLKPARGARVGCTSWLAAGVG